VRKYCYQNIQIARTYLKLKKMLTLRYSVIQW